MSENDELAGHARRSLDDVIEPGDPVEGYVPDDEGFFGAPEQYGADGVLPGVHRRAAGSHIKSVLAILISLGILVGGGWFAVTKIQDGWQSLNKPAADYSGPGEKDVNVTIKPGASAADIAQILVDSDVVASTQAFTQAALDEPNFSSIQAAIYKLKTKMSAKQAVAALLDPNNIVHDQFTVPEGQRNTLVAQTIAKATGISAAELQSVMDSGQGLTLPGYARGKTEGFLFPETYSYDQNSKAVDVLNSMTAQFAKVTADIGFEQKAKALGVDPYDAVTIASIIEKETSDPKYGPDIAQVLYNRLKMGMQLQLDSTVIYANNLQGAVTTSDQQRAVDSPYNTYVAPALPPGAISNPGKNSLNSAVNPTQGDLLYFVATNPDTGEIKFAKDKAGHDKNVAEFQAWCQAAGSRCSGG